MSMPSASSEPFTPPPGFAEALAATLGAPGPQEFHYASKGGAGVGALIAVWASPAEVKALKPKGDLEAVLLQVNAGSLVATSPGDGKPYDFVSRFFAPHLGVPEDPVTGSAHTALTPFWAKRLGRKQLRARQASPRGGDLLCTDDGARVILEGPCALYLTGEIEV
jgi:predicted PhzF superfamily epimerase YddE/YHI9